jgi:GNAT superfamily N-acetyltransferase
MVLAAGARGRGVGGTIIEWCANEAVRLGRQFLRLDCHSGNPWLCAYYERHGFQLVDRVQQHPGYVGCLYQRAVTS